MPGSGIDRVDGVAGDIGIVQCVDVEINVYNIAQPVGQGAQQFCKFAGLRLCLRHADGLEAKGVPRLYLGEPPEIGRNVVPQQVDPGDAARQP